MTRDPDASPGAELGQSGDDFCARAADLPEGAAGQPVATADDLFGLELEGFGGQAIRPPIARGRGRPPGSPNRSTTKLREMLLARGYRDPMEWQAALITADPRELAAALAGGKVEHVTFAQALEVAKLQRAAASDLNPYFNQAMPKQVEVKTEALRPLFVINRATSAIDETNQRVVDVTPRASHDGASHERVQDDDLSRVFGDDAHD